jgi:hypothetical protein
MYVHEGPHVGLVCQLGAKTGLVIGFPTECLMTRLVVRQASGTSVGYRVRTYRSKRGFPQSSASLVDDGVEDPEMYRLTDAGRDVGGEASAGEMVKWENPVGVPYRNADGTVVRRKYELYVIIDAEGDPAETGTFDIIVGAMKFPRR